MSIYIRNSLIKKRKVEKASNAMRFDAQTLFCSDLDDPREVWKNSEAAAIDAEAASCDVVVDAMLVKMDLDATEGGPSDPGHPT